MHFNNTFWDWTGINIKSSTDMNPDIFLKINNAANVCGKREWIGQIKLCDFVMKETLHDFLRHMGFDTVHLEKSVELQSLPAAWTTSPKYRNIIVSFTSCYIKYHITTNIHMHSALFYTVGLLMEILQLTSLWKLKHVEVYC